MRQLILDTETTGLVPEEGHRIIEIGAIEMIDRRFTGNNYHKYINPERNVEAGALAVHGLTDDFLSDKPLFAAIVTDFIEYIKDAELIIHNAPFDIGFLNHEFKLCEQNLHRVNEYVTVFDTLAMARNKHPGQKNNLDALCKRYNIDNSNRQLHGALLDAKLLAEVYLAMTSGQTSMFVEERANVRSSNKAKIKTVTLDREPLVVTKATEAEIKEHEAYLAKIKEQSSQCVWLDE